jgi:hypothetical protein
MIKHRILALGLLALGMLVVLAASPVTTTSQVAAGNGYVCSVATVTGSWAFKTDGFYMQSGLLDGNALGIFEVFPDGKLKGKYDWQGVNGFYPGTAYEGTVRVNPDCTGTFRFHDVGSNDVVTQSIVIARSGREILGMMQDPAADVGTFRAIRLIEGD